MTLTPVAVRDRAADIPVTAEFVERIINQKARLCGGFDSEVEQTLSSLTKWMVRPENFGAKAARTFEDVVSGTSGSPIVTASSSIFADYTEGDAVVIAGAGVASPVVLAYDNETAPFTVGQTLTKSGGGATGTIVKVLDLGSTGLISYTPLTGTFVDNDVITDGGGGSASVNGAPLITPAAPLVTTILTKNSNTQVTLATNVLTTVNSVDCLIGKDATSSFTALMAVSEYEEVNSPSQYLEGGNVQNATGTRKRGRVAIEIPPGAYFVKDLTITKGFSLVGKHRMSMLMPFPGASFMLKVQVGTGAYSNREAHHPWTRIENLMLYGLDRQVSSDGIILDRTDHIHMVGVTAYLLNGTAINFLDSVRESYFSDIHVRLCGNDTKPSVDMLHTSTRDSHNNLDFFDFRVVYPYGMGVRLGKSGVATQGPRHVHFYGGMHHGAVADPSPVTNVVFGDLSFGSNNVLFEIGDASGIHFYSTTFNRYGDAAIKFTDDYSGQTALHNPYFGSHGPLRLGLSDDAAILSTANTGGRCAVLGGTCDAPYALNSKSASFILWLDPLAAKRLAINLKGSTTAPRYIHGQTVFRSSNPNSYTPDYPGQLYGYRSANVTTQALYMAGWNDSGPATSDWIQLQTIVARTAAQIGTASDAINTVGKTAGKKVYDSTNGRWLYTKGSTATDPWYKESDETLAITPA